MPSPITHTLLPAACAALSGRGFPKLNTSQWLKFIVLAAIMGNGPDWDVIPASLAPDQWASIHREWGHNIFSVLLLSLMGTFALKRWVSHEFTTKQAGIISALLVGSHIFLDAMMAADAMGVRPGVPIFWPISDFALNMPWELFPHYQMLSEGHPLARHLLAPQFWTRVVGVELGTVFMGTIGYYAMMKLWPKRRPMETSHPVKPAGV